MSTSYMGDPDQDLYNAAPFFIPSEPPLFEFPLSIGSSSEWMEATGTISAQATEWGTRREKEREKKSKFSRIVILGAEIRSSQWFSRFFFFLILIFFLDGYTGRKVLYKGRSLYPGFLLYITHKKKKEVEYWWADTVRTTALTWFKLIFRDGNQIEFPVQWTERQIWGGKTNSSPTSENGKRCNKRNK